jgi:hypothetical protein
MQDAGIVRNRAKIEGDVAFCARFLDVMDKGPGFAKHIWGFVDGRPKVNCFRSIRQVPPETADLARDVQGTGAARLQVLRADHRLRLHAGGRHGQRPSDHVPPPRSSARRSGGHSLTALVPAKATKPVPEFACVLLNSFAFAGMSGG